MQVEPNNGNELDQQFEDHAWSQMAEILDREMPVKKKRRLLFWFFLLFGILIGGAAVFHFSSQEVAVGSSTQASVVEQTELFNSNKDLKQKEQIAQREKTSAATNQQATTKRQAATTATAEQSQASIATENADSPSAAANKDAQVKTTIQSDEDKHSETSDQQHIYIDSLTDETTPKTDNHLPIIAQQTPAEDEQVIISDLNLRLEQLQKHPLQQLDRDNFSIRKKLIEPKQSRLDWYLQVSEIATLQNDFHLSFGAGLAYRLSAGWQIQSGVSWIFPKQRPASNLEFDVPPDLMDTMFAENSNTGNYDFLETHSDSILFTSRGYHFLRIPLRIAYQFHPRFKSYFGGQINLPMIGETAEQLFDNEMDITVVRTTAPTVVDFSNLRVQPNLQWHVGLQFFVSEHWIIDGAYHHLLPNQSGRNHLERFFELGLQYQF